MVFELSPVIMRLWTLSGGSEDAILLFARVGPLPVFQQNPNSIKESGPADNIFPLQTEEVLPIQDIGSVISIGSALSFLHD
jgi:hypothetical protein